MKKMMRRSLWMQSLSFLTSLCLFSSTAAFAADPKAEPATSESKPSSQEPRFAVVDMQRIILSVEEGKKARSELEKKIQAKEKELQDKKKKLDKMNEEWKQQSSVLSEEAKNRKQKEFQDTFMQLRNEEANFQNELKKEESTATQKIASKVAKMVDGLAKSKNIDVVFEMNSSGLLYVKDPIDLTEQLIKAYDKAQ
ncbi:MAG: OmpH family outer membrane protein [Oligoflexales bacterium]|nr:OmpH family outer membrane protein [Oligoflexales bacterium]